MNRFDWKDPLDRIEEQLDAVSSSFSRGDSDDLTHSAHLLELMCKELVDWASTQPEIHALSAPELQQAKLLGERLLTLRQTLLQRASYVEHALRQIVPSIVGDTSTYAGALSGGKKNPYGMGLRPSGTFNAMRA
jgi:hypothetical protein